MTRSQVRDFDRWAINYLGIPGTTLMENAGRSCAELIIHRLANVDSPHVSIFCGLGNNGGDGYVIARHLAGAGFEVKVIICGPQEKIKGDALINLEIIREMKLPIEQLDMNAVDLADQANRFITPSHTLVDAIFGTGLKDTLRGEYRTLIGAINTANLPVIAVDIPSGLDCDTGLPLPCAIKADATVTFVAIKKGFTAPAAAAYTGRIFLASIGVEPGR